MAKRLLMTFKTLDGATTSLTVDKPRDGLTEAEVRAVMDNIIVKNIFETKKGDLVEIKSAEIISTNEEILI